MLAVISGTDSTIEAASRNWYRTRSAGASRSVCPAMQSPTASTWRTNSSVESRVRQPGMDSSLSSVPPVCPSDRPEIMGTGTPAAATSGATRKEILSPTPPVECLSAGG